MNLPIPFAPRLLLYVDSAVPKDLKFFSSKPMPLSLILMLLIA